VKLLIPLVSIECNKNQVKFSVIGDIGNGSITIKQGAVVDAEEGGSTTIQVNSPVQATFSLKYLMNFTKATSLCDMVNLSISNELPIVVEYKVSDLGYIRYFLAPRYLVGHVITR
jgi:proliferating cell nuclear antigen